MTAAELLARATGAGFTLTAAADGTLRIRGPRDHEQLARELMARKAEVLDAIGADPRAGFIRTGIDPTRPAAPCPICGFPTYTPEGEEPATCTRCIAHVVRQAWHDLHTITTQGVLNG